MHASDQHTADRPCGLHLYCFDCRAASPVDSSVTCAACGNPLALQAGAVPSAALMRRRPQSMWHYFALLPPRSRKHICSLGEGATPLVETPQLNKAAGLGGLWLKNEAANPTGSFKDRQIAVAVSRARETGHDTVAAVSSGNVAAATAAYAARAGLRAVLFMHAHAAPAKIAQAQQCGAHVLRVDSPSAHATFDLCRAACRRYGWYHASTAGIYAPYNVEGAKTIAYELYQAFGRDLPHWVVAPVGGGGLLGALWRGFLDLQRLKLIDRAPRLAGVQAAGCAPLKQAIDNGWTFQESLAHPWSDPHTIAGGLADDILFDGHTALPAIRETGGAALAVEDDAIEDAVGQLARAEGLFCELSSAPAIAGLSGLPGAGQDTRVCCIVTGAGVKDFGHWQSRGAEAPVVAPSEAALHDCLQREVFEA